MKNNFTRLSALACILALASIPLKSEALNTETARDCTTVTLRALDKINAKTEAIVATLGEPAKFENLKIVVRRCLKSGIAEPADTAIFVEINETFSADNARNIYKGWMFASSPSLSTLDHPTFGVWVKRDQVHDKDTDDEADQEESGAQAVAS